MPFVVPYIAAAATAISGTTVTVATVSTVLTYASIALAAGSVVYSMQQSAEMQKKAKAAAKANQGMTLTSRDPAAQRRVIYGQMRVGGTIVFMDTEDAPGGPTNEYLHMVITLAGHEVQEIGDIYFDDVLVPIYRPGDTIPVDGGGIPLYGLGDVQVGNKYLGKARIKMHLGTDSQTADSDLVAECPAKWTTDHRLRGVAYIYVRLKYDAKVYSGLPNITAVVKGKKVLDPRTSTSAWTANPVLCLRDYLTNTDYGIGAASDELDDATFIAKANLCDENVSLNGGGTEKRYTLNGAITRDTAPVNFIETVMGACASALVYTAGFWSLSAGAYETPTVDFSWDDLRGEVSMQTADSLRDTCNGVKGTFISPDNKWQPADYPPVKNATYYTQDGSVRIWRELELPMTASAATAQRIAKIALEKARQDITVKLPLKLQGLKVRAGDVITLTLDRYGWTAKPFEVMSWKFVTQGAGFGADNSAPILGVDLELRETASTVWDWSTANETPTDPAPNTNLPEWRTVGVPRSLAVASTATVLADGGVTASITASWLAPLDSLVVSGGNIQTEYQLTTDTDWTPGPVVTGDQLKAVFVPVRMGSVYRVRVRSVNSVGTSSAWSVSSNVTAAGDTTAPAVPTSFAVSGVYKGIRVKWVNPTDADLAYIDVYEHTAATPVPDGSTVPIARTYGSEFVRAELALGAVRYYWVRAVDASGNKSAWIGGLSATALAVGNLEITSTQIADDSISTPKLQAASITAYTVGTNEIIASSANLGNAVVTTAKIGDAQVSTLKIGNNAVTVPMFASGTTSASGSVVLDQAGFVMVIFGGQIPAGVTSAAARTVTLTIGGVNRATATAAYSSSGASSASEGYGMTLAAGTTTISVACSGSTSLFVTATAAKR